MVVIGIYAELAFSVISTMDLRVGVPGPHKPQSNALRTVDIGMKAIDLFTFGRPGINSIDYKILWSERSSLATMAVPFLSPLESETKWVYIQGLPKIGALFW